MCRKSFCAAAEGLAQVLRRARLLPFLHQGIPWNVSSHAMYPPVCDRKYVLMTSGGSHVDVIARNRTDRAGEDIIISYCENGRRTHPIATLRKDADDRWTPLEGIAGTSL